MASAPPARGVRLPWEALPASARAAVERHLGALVTAAVTRPGGFSPGIAAELELADTRKVFVKAVGPEPNADSPAMHRREAGIAAALPAEAPVPRLLFSHEEQGWVVLVFEHVDGHEPAMPWRIGELERVLAALAELSEALSPSPIELESFAEWFADQFHGWRTLAAQGGAAGLDPWAAEHLDQLAELEAGWVQASSGSTLLHCDVRADNVLLTADRVVLVDWPHACIGAAWIDLVGFLPSVAMQGGPPAWEVFERHPLGRAAPRESVLPVLAGVAGYFVHGAMLPPPPGIPTVREFQRAQGVEALAWLRRSLGES